MFSLFPLQPEPNCSFPPSYVLVVFTIIEIWQEVSFTEGMIS